jgi:nucleoside-diphosphate-sugar epimerase
MDRSPANRSERAIGGSPVLVTGATGFIGSRVIEVLLARGRRVRGTVRSSTTGQALDALRALEGAGDRLDFVEADLMDPAGLTRAAAGCGTVIHTASPYVLDAKNPQEDLVDPAVEGTRHVLDAARAAGTVTRVVVTSSMAAITDEPGSDRVLTEADWNRKSSLRRNPYYLSKMLAEREAWTFVERERPAFDLVVINPFVVIGPSLVPSLNTSNRVFVDLLEGVYPGLMRLTWGFVDVRDVAEAHVRALERPGAHGRYLCAGETVTMRAVVDLLAANGWGRGRKLPRVALDHPFGDVVIKLASLFQPRGAGSYLRTHVGRTPRYDTTKIRTELGMTFRPAAESMLDTMDDLARWGHITPRVT